MSVAVEGSDQDFDLNIAPIIDCFTVLIAYLLISASFVSVGFFDVGVSTVSQASAQESPPSSPQELMAVGLGTGRTLEIKLSGPESATVAIPPRAGGERDYIRLLSEVHSIRSRWPALEEVSVNADSQVEYREVIQAIDSLKKEMPKVFVGD